VETELSFYIDFCFFLLQYRDSKCSKHTMKCRNVIGYETMTSDHYRTSYDLRALISTHGPLSQDTKITWIRPVVFQLPCEVNGHGKNCRK